ncbi:hypothetical protein D3C71_1564300 [compost metagenome]
MRWSSWASGWLWSTTWWAPSARTQSRVSGREALAMTVRLVSRAASWVRMEPTPPAAPMISSALPPGCLPGSTPKRSNSSSQAVIAVSGSAAACAKSSDLGAWPTMRSSTRCSWLFVPGRAIEPAYQTRSPGWNSVTCGPTALTMPLASQPSTLYSCPSAGAALLRTLVSTGFTDIALTSTSRSRPVATGSGRVMSSSASACAIGWGVW